MHKQDTLEAASVVCSLTSGQPSCSHSWDWATASCLAEAYVNGNACTHLRPVTWGWMWLQYGHAMRCDADHRPQPCQCPAGAPWISTRTPTVRLGPSVFGRAPTAGIGNREPAACAGTPAMKTAPCTFDRDYAVGVAISALRGGETRCMQVWYTAGAVSTFAQSGSRIRLWTVKNS